MTLEATHETTASDGDRMRAGVARLEAIQGGTAWHHAQATADELAHELATSTGPDRMSVCDRVCYRAGELVGHGLLDISDAADLIDLAAASCGLYVDAGPDAVQESMAAGFRDGAAAAREDRAETVGSRLLQRVHEFIGRFVAYPSKAAHVAHTLWIAHTHAMEAWDSTPRLAALSPEPGSGKTRLLEVTELLVPNPVEAVNVSPAYLFRKVGTSLDARPSILFDEIDTVFGPKAKENEEIRGLLNAGHRKGAVAGRCVVRGKVVETEEIPAYCAVALAGLGSLPDTILTRSVVLRMRKRAPDEQIKDFRRRLLVDEGARLRNELAEWAKDVIGNVVDTWPAMPLGVVDRDADVWEPLLIVADRAEGVWPERAREAAVALVSEAKETSPSLGVRLLGDLRTLFGTADKMPTEKILNELHAMKEAPWGDMRGQPMKDRQLAKLLKPYGVAPKLVKIAGQTSRGYDRTDLHDPWKRYLPPQSDKSVTTVTTVTEPENPGLAGNAHGNG